MLVPVLDKNNKPLMPCSPARARLLMKSGSARSYYQKGIFCIKMLRDPSDNKKQEVVLGIDPGSKREGYTVATANAVVVNITTNTPDWVKNRLETRKYNRKSRRHRKTPYRKCRFNRKVKNGFLPPSTKARWNKKINMIKCLSKILPLTKMNIEEIKAKSKEGKAKWNKNFSPLQHGKKYFDEEVKKLNIPLVKTQGYETAKRRELRGFKKSSKKLEYIWETHNIDSHILCELALNKEIVPDKKLYKIEYLQFHRRQLHVQNPIKGGIRKQYGKTITFGKSRGSILKYIGGNNKTSIKNLFLGKFYYLGGSSKGKISIYDIKNKKRISQKIKFNEVKILYTNNKTIEYIK